MEMRAEIERLRERFGQQDEQLARLQRRHVTMLPYRERKLRKFGGDEPFDEWEMDAQAAITGSGMTPEEESEFLFLRLEGAARREVLCRGGHANLSAERLLHALGEVFSKKGVVPRLLSRFWARDQAPGESLAAYSHILMQLLEEIARADPQEVPDQAPLLLKKFCAGVADPNLRWELKQQQRSDPDVTFIDVRATALRWAEECAPQERAFAKSATAATASAADPTSDALKQLFSQLLKLQTMMEKQGAAIQELQERAAQPVGQSVARPARPTRPQLCYYCQQPGHFSQACRQRIRDGARNGPPAPGPHFPGRPRQ